jgi:dTDP-glucose 4,6-dehydratase
MSKTILVTGGAGFIGSNFIAYFLGKYKEYKIINLDKLTYAGDLMNLKEVENNPSYKLIQGDICNRELVKHIFTTIRLHIRTFLSKPMLKVLST